MHASSWSWRDRIAVLAGLLLPLAVSGILVPFRTHFANSDLALALVAVVVAVAANGNRLAGFLAAASAALWFDFFFTRPYEQLSITAREDLWTTFLLLLVGVAVTEVAVRGRRQRVLAVTDEAYLSAIGATTQLIGDGRSSLEVTSLVSRELTSLLGLRSCRFERSSFGGLPRLEADGRLLIGRALLGPGPVRDADRTDRTARACRRRRARQVRPRPRPRHGRRAGHGPPATVRALPGPRQAQRQVRRTVPAANRPIGAARTSRPVRPSGRGALEDAERYENPHSCLVKVRSFPDSRSRLERTHGLVNLLSIRADVLNGGGADRAGNAGETFDPGKPGLHTRLHEFVP